MTQRRFNEAEVAAIFKQATEAQQMHQGHLPSGKGMTVSELQEIGREVGISSDLIENAARVIDQAGTPTSRTFLGLPIGVGQTVELDRKITEEEWERLVVDLRETFDARGIVRGEGSLRQWTNGNLQALLEPTPTGHRIRLRTIKGDARGMMVGGIAMFGGAATALLAAAFQGGLGDTGMLSSLGFLATMGAGMFGAGALRLPSWARLRRQQMKEVAGRLAVVAKAPLSLDRPRSEPEK